MYGEGEAEAAFAVDVVVIVEAEVVGFGEFAGDKEAEAVALGVGAEKRFKQAVAHVFGHAWAVVADFDARAMLCAEGLGIDADALAAKLGFAVLAGVVEQDDEDLLQMSGVNAGAEAGAYGDVKLDAIERGIRSVACDEVV